MPVVDAQFIMLLLSGVATLGMLGFSLRRRRLRDASSRVLAGCLALSAGWLTVLALQGLRWLSLYLLLALAVVFYQLTRQFTQQPGSGLRWWAGGTAWLAACVALVSNPWGIPPPLRLTPEFALDRLSMAYLLLLCGWATFTGGALLLALRKGRKKRTSLHRNRRIYWSLAAALVAAGGGLALGHLLLAGSLVQLLGLVIAVYAQLTYDLPDLRLAMRKSAVFLLSILLTAAAYSAAYLLVRALFPQQSMENPLLMAVILAVLLAAGLNPLLQVGLRRLHHRLRGQTYDPQQTQREYSLAISNILDLDLLAAVAVGLISTNLRLTHGALAAVRLLPLNSEAPTNPGAPTGTYVLRPVDNLGLPLAEIHLSANSPVVLYLRQAHAPLTQYDIDLLPRFRDLSFADRASLAQLDMDVYVPVYAKDSWIGLIALGPKISGERYYTEDLTLLQLLADQTAVALENARLYANLKQRNSENERLNQDLSTANTQLARLDQAKSDFINIASHELRTPLTQVIGYVDILHDMIGSGALDPDTGVQMVDSVRRAARRLEEVVDTMFDVSKLDTRSLDLNCSPVSLASIISVALDNWSQGIEERRLQVSVQGVAGLPVINADRKRLVQVFAHLVQNAMKSTPDGGRIEIRGREVTEGPGTGCNRWVEVSVTDNGIGIAAEDLEQIFEKFYRVGSVLLHSSGETKFRGAGPGLGLTIARGIVEAHGGRVWAQSPGFDPETCPGASFTVQLPV